MAGLLGREARRAARAVVRAVGREEDERVRERDPLCAGGRCVGARQLDERGRSRGVVVQAAVGAAVVPVRHDHDLGRRETGSRLLRHEVDERRAAAVDRGGERLAPDVEAVRLQLVAKPGRGASGIRRAGSPVRIVGGEVVGDVRGRLRVEGGRQAGQTQRRRAGDAERKQQERQSDEQPGAAVEARVDGTLERSRPRPSALGCGRGGRHGVQSRAGSGRVVFPWKRSGVRSPGRPGRAKRRVNIGPASRATTGTLVVEIGGFRFPNLRELHER